MSSIHSVRYCAHETTTDSAAMRVRAMSGALSCTSRAPCTSAANVVAARKNVEYFPKRVGRME